MPSVFSLIQYYEDISALTFTKNTYFLHYFLSKFSVLIFN
ncbi:hypothetical protein ATN83_0041 [Raoultella ornithinolytica]|nr:hypothetical protein ATN83_0041 [Raoultella ornithinolytica]KDV91088.1 hypothetical protein AB00_4815 [Raoultella ornithinolytica 2-156-04_S1_C1]KDX09937.1 hypothetical protein AB28_5037 [Raoultella ornithinolytica 2-156-04_S1_C2]